MCSLYYTYIRTKLNIVVHYVMVMFHKFILKIIRKRERMLEFLNVGLHYSYFTFACTSVLCCNDTTIDVIRIDCVFL